MYINRANVAWILMFVQCCLTSTETVWTVRDGEPRTSTSTSTQLLSSKAYWMSSSSLLLLRPQRPYGLLGTGSRGRPPRLSHISWTLWIPDKTFHINNGEHCGEEWNQLHSREANHTSLNARTKLKPSCTPPVSTVQHGRQIEARGTVTIL